jgi:hypothetical protein
VGQNRTLKQRRDDIDEHLRKRSWSVVASHLIGGIALVVVAVAIGKLGWQIPTENSLAYAQGNFLNQPHDDTDPYTFVTTEGNRLSLVCDPGARGASCLEQQGVSVQSLAGKHTVIGYFRATAPWWKFGSHRSDVIVTLNRDSRNLLSFVSSRARLEEDRRVAAFLNFVPGMIVLLIAALQVFLAVRITRAKLKRQNGT